MKDNMKTFKNIADSALNDIHITEELKQKTLAKCKKQKQSKIRPAYAAGIFAALIAFTTTGYNYLFPDSPIKKYNFMNMTTAENKLENIENLIKQSIINPDTNKNQKTKLKNNINPKYAYNSEDSSDKKTNDIKNTNETENTLVPQISGNGKNDSQDIKSSEDTNSTSKTSDDNTMDKDIKTTSDNTDRTTKSTVNDNKNPEENKVEHALELKNKSDEELKLDMNKAINYFNDSVYTPSFIPDGFKLINITMPDDRSGSKFINLEYTNNSYHFNIKQDRNINFNNNIGEKMNINNIEAYSCWIESSSETRISFNKNGIQYSIQGNISKDTLINILISMN